MRILLIITLAAINCAAVFAENSRPTGMLSIPNSLMPGVDANEIKFKNTTVSDTEPVSVTVTTTQGGQLAEMLKDNIHGIDAITVKGFINEEDFRTLWESSFNGLLKEIDLGQAIVEKGIIPDLAFIYWEEQYLKEGFYSIQLEKIILPEGVTEIGEMSFGYAMKLKEIRLPATLQKVSNGAFTHCISLDMNPFVLPENLKEIGVQAFDYCYALKGKVVLPSGIRTIDVGAFYSSGIPEINFPESLEYIGAMAFTLCNLKEIDLPDNCKLDPQGSQFSSNYNLERVRLPTNLSEVPEQIFNTDMSLHTVKFPMEATYITRVRDKN